MALRSRAKWVAAKIETTKGSAETLGATEANILAFDPVINQGINFTERAPVGLAAGQALAVPEEHIATARLQVELKGSGTGSTLPDWAKTLLIASAMEEDSGVGGKLNPVADLTKQKTVTLAIWEGQGGGTALKKILAGGMCNATIEGEFAKRALITFDVTGIWQSPVDESPPSGISYDSTQPLRVAAATFSRGSAAKKVSNFTFDFGNDIQLRPDVQQSGGTGLAHAYMADRRPTIGFDPEADLVANDDVFGDWIGQSTAALAIALGSTTGNQVAIDVAALQYIDPQEQSRQGLLAHQIQSNVVNEVGSAADPFNVQFDQ